MLLLLCLLLLGKIESQVFLDALDGGVQVDLVAVVVKRSLMRYIINRGRADGRRAQLFDQGIPIAGQRVGGVGLLPVRDGLRQIGVFHIPLYREALVEGIQLHNGVCQHDLDKSFCQCGVGGVSRDGNDLFGLKAAAGQRPDGNGGVAPKQLQRVGTAAYNAGTAGVTPLGHLDQAHGKLRLGHALSVAAGHHILVGLGGDLLAIDHLSGGLQECAQRVLVNALLLREEPGAGGNIERAAAEKKIKAAQHALERFEGEILKCLDGTSNFTEDMIAKQIRRYQQELDDAKAEYAELQNARLNEAAEIRKLRTYYDDFKGWAEEFDTAPLEMKRMILSHLIDRVEVGRKYQVIVKFNMKYRQFLECTAETYNTEIGA